MKTRIQSQSSKLSLFVALLLLGGLSLGCQRPELYETDEAATTTRPPSDTEIRPLADEVAEYPRAFEAQAKQTINTLQRAQQAHYLERKQFTDSIQSLGVGIELDGKTYTYQIVPQETESWVLIHAIPKFEPLRSYTGIVFVVGRENLLSLICESNAHATTPPPLDTNQYPIVNCGQGSQLIH